MVFLFTFIRHAETKADYTLPPREWWLSPQGEIHRFKLIQSPKCQSITALYSSSEPKAIQTATPLAQHLQIPLEINENFDEVQINHLPTKSRTKYLHEKQLAFSKAPFHSFSLPYEENYFQALRRFQNTITQITTSHNKADHIAIISHGTVLTLFLASLLDHLHDGEWLYSTWLQFPFLGIFQVQKGEVIPPPWVKEHT